MISLAVTVCGKTRPGQMVDANTILSSIKNYGIQEEPVRQSVTSNVLGFMNGQLTKLFQVIVILTSALHYESIMSKITS